MSAVESRAHIAETTFINEWADYHRLDFVVDARKFGDLGERGPCDALDLLEVLRNGEVISSDMDDNFGIWMVVGETVDDDLLKICVRVKSTEHRVELIDVVKL
jgi:hypothetical protein